MYQSEKVMVGGLGPGSPEKGSHTHGGEGLMVGMAQAQQAEALGPLHRKWEKVSDARVSP